MQNVLTFYLNRKRVMQNGILGISVEVYCIRPLRMSPKETYDQKYRYMWGVCNTPLPWRTKRSIPKINFGVMQNGMILFLIWKRVMRNGIGIFLNWEIVMQNVLTFYLNRKRVMQNGRKGFWENVLESYFEVLILREYFPLSQNGSTPNLWWKSRVQNRKNLFEDVYSSSPLRMDALSENKQ